MRTSWVRFPLTCSTQALPCSCACSTKIPTQAD
jgi:hypothetical protein